jgi:hypothetical protein
MTSSLFNEIAAVAAIQQLTKQLEALLQAPKPARNADQRLLVWAEIGDIIDARIEVLDRQVSAKQCTPASLPAVAEAAAAP